MPPHVRPGMPPGFLLAALTAALLSSCAATGQRQPDGTAPDTIYHHGKIITVDGRSGVAEAFAVSGDHFTAVGDEATVTGLAGKHTRIVDLGGATVIPGLTDSHDHMWNSAKFEFRGVDMIGVTTLSEMQTRLRTAVAKVKPGETVFTTMGWSVRPAPSLAELDAISSEIPIAVVGSRHATGVVNSAALRRLGISKANPMFKGARVPVDQNGEPTGTLPVYPQSLEMVDTLLPPISASAEEEVVTKAMRKRNALGITSTRELALWPAGVTILQRMAREGRLTLRIAVGVEFPDQAETARSLAALPPVKRDDPWLFLDSAGEEPWTPGTMSRDDYIAIIREERRLGWRPAPHVSADAARGASYDDATDQTLTAYETIHAESPLNGLRWYIEHVSFASPAEIERMARMGVIVSVQDAGYEPAARPPLPPDRMAHQNPVRSLLDHGIVVIGGSDYTSPNAIDPEPDNPMSLIYFYVTRKTRSGDVATPSEKITREQALRIFTVNAAYATFQEKVKGQIAAGMLADFVILNQDLMTVPDDKILATRPLATYVGGRQVYAVAGTHY